MLGQFNDVVPVSASQSVLSLLALFTLTLYCSCCLRCCLYLSWQFKCFFTAAKCANCLFAVISTIILAARQDLTQLAQIARTVNRLQEDVLDRRFVIVGDQRVATT